MYQNSNNTGAGRLYSVLQKTPQAVAQMRGSARHSKLSGTVKFYRARRGVLVVAEIVGLPVARGACDGGVFAFHIHGGASCTGTGEDPFADAGSHYDPYGCPHPYHAGDMPPLFGAGGEAFLAFFTDRFTVDEILGKTVIIHGGADDFTSQPAGNAGNKIACGVIRGTG